MYFYIISFLLVGSIGLHNSQCYSQMPDIYNKDAKSFNWALKQLPPNFKEAENIGTVYYKYNDMEEARKRRSEKEEFETTQQYKERIKREIKPIPFIIHSFVYSIDSEYDADRQLLNVTVNLEKYNYLKNKRTIVLGVGKRTGKEFIEYRTDYGLSFPITENIKKEIIYNSKGIFPGPAILFKIKVNIEKAKKIKDGLKSLIICRPFQTKHDCYLSGAETSYFYSVIIVNILEIWIYNVKTGEIMHKERLLG